jgi:hypothetical protein
LTQVEFVIPSPIFFPIPDFAERYDPQWP